MAPLKSLFPSRKQWKAWAIPSKHTTLGLLVGLVALVLTLIFGLPPFLDYLAAKRPRPLAPPPSIEFGFISLPERYKDGLLVHGVKWRPSFSRHTFTFANASTNTPIEQLRVLLLLPAGIARYAPVAVEDCQGLTLSQYNPPSGITRPDGVVDSLREAFRNDLTMTVARVNPGGRLRLELVTEYRGENDDAGWCDLDYSFGSQPQIQRVAARHPILVQQRDPLALRIDTSTNHVAQLVRPQIIVMPDPPITYSDGLEIKSFDVGFPALPNANQPLIPLTVNIDFGDTLLRSKTDTPLAPKNK